MWTLVVIFYFPALKIGFTLSHQLVAAQFFISQLILILAWTLSGPVTSTCLTLLSAIVALYLALGAKEPAFFLQLLLYAVFFIVMISYLHAAQKQTSDKRIAKEKLAEELNLTREAITAKKTLKAALEKKVDRYLDLRRFSEELKNITDLEEAAKKIVSEVHSALDQADQCVLYLVDESRQELSLAAANGTAVREKDGTLFDRWSMKHAQGLMIEDAASDFRFSVESRAGMDTLRSVCVSPLISERRVLGVVRASSAKQLTFSTEDLRLMDVFSSLGAVTLRNILRYRRMGELAIRDSLTGLYLNRYFQERLSEEIQRALAGKSGFSLILLDIDHFKHYNDDFGHMAGDLVLKNIAGLITDCLGSQDLAARYGGEEFAVILPDRSAAEALKMSEKMRLAIKAGEFMIRRQPTRVTASFGFASFPEDGRTKEDLIRQVDKNLYRAKNEGRDRVCGNT